MSIDRRIQARDGALREMERLIKPDFEPLVEQLSERFFDECMRGTRDPEDFFVEILEKYGEDAGEQWILHEIRMWYSVLAFFKPDRWWGLTNIGRVIESNLKGPKKPMHAEQIRGSQKRCVVCGNYISATAKFCTKCGAHL